MGGMHVVWSMRLSPQFPLHRGQERFILFLQDVDSLIWPNNFIPSIYSDSFVPIHHIMRLFFPLPSLVGGSHLCLLFFQFLLLFVQPLSAPPLIFRSPSNAFKFLFSFVVEPFWSLSCPVQRPLCFSTHSPRTVEWSSLSLYPPLPAHQTHQPQFPPHPTPFLFPILLLPTPPL